MDFDKLDKLENKSANKKNNIGCLLIHGFGGNVDEIKPLADVLTAQGYTIEMPKLKGHTGNRKDLKRCNYRDWIISAQHGLDKLRIKCGIIYIIGFSMGGLIAFQLARINKVDAIVTLNTPIYYWDLKRVALNIVEDIRSRKFTNLRRYVYASYMLPIKALLNFRLLLFMTKHTLANIESPAFIIQASKDDTVHKSSADFIYGNIGSKNKKIEFYEESGHLILWGKDANNVMKDIINFIGKIK